MRYLTFGAVTLLAIIGCWFLLMTSLILPFLGLLGVLTIVFLAMRALRTLPAMPWPKTDKWEKRIPLLETLQTDATYALKWAAGTILLIGSILLLGSLLFFPILKRQRTEKKLADISLALADYQLQHKSYPASLNELVKESPLRSNWLLDAWNKPFSYTLLSNGHYSLRSPGPDGLLKTDDDLLNP